MNKEDKIQFILKDIGNNYEDFLKQSYSKLAKQSKIIEIKVDHRELVSDIMMSIIDNLTTLKYVNKYYNMCVHNKLRLYVFKAIDINTKSTSAPFLRRKLKQLNRYVFNDNMNSEEVCSDTFNNREMLIKLIYSMLEYPYSKVVFGPDYKYYTTIVKEYINDPKATYNSIEKKYGFPTSTMARHLSFAKECIRTELKKLGIFNIRYFNLIDE